MKGFIEIAFEFGLMCVALDRIIGFFPDDETGLAVFVFEHRNRRKKNIRMFSKEPYEKVKRRIAAAVAGFAEGIEVPNNV